MAEYAKGLKYFKEGDYVKAIAEWEVFVKDKPHHLDARLGLFDCYLDINYREYALSHLEQAEKDHEHSEKIHYRYARYHYDDADYSKAKEHLNKMLKPYEVLLSLESSKEVQEEALKTLKPIDEKNALYNDVMYLHMLVSFNLGDYDTAETYLDQHQLHVEPEDVDILEEMAKIFESNEKYDKAIEYLRKVRKIKPDTPETALINALCSRAKATTESAQKKKDYEEVLRYNNTHSESKAALAKIYRDVAEESWSTSLEKAFSSLKNVVKYDPSQQEEIVQKITDQGKSHHQAEEYKWAEICYKEALTYDRNGKDVDALYIETLLAWGKQADDPNKYISILEIDKDHEPAKEALARWYLSKDQLKEAIDVNPDNVAIREACVEHSLAIFTKLLSKKKHQKEAHNWIDATRDYASGLNEKRRKEVDESIIALLRKEGDEPSLEQALGIDPEHAGAKKDLVQLQAQPLIEKEKELLLSMRSYYGYDNDTLTEALTLFKHARAIDPDHQGIKEQVNLILFDKGKDWLEGNNFWWDGAIACFDAIAPHTLPESHIPSEMALLCFAQGKSWLEDRWGNREEDVEIAFKQAIAYATDKQSLEKQIAELYSEQDTVASNETALEYDPENEAAKAFLAKHYVDKNNYDQALIYRTPNNKVELEVFSHAKDLNDEKEYEEAWTILVACAPYAQELSDFSSFVEKVGKTILWIWNRENDPVGMREQYTEFQQQLNSIQSALSKAHFETIATQLKRQLDELPF